MAANNKPRKESADESQEMTFISLMLLLFCFMVIMVSLAQVQGPRFRSAIGSVRGAFSLLRSSSQTSMISSGGPGVLSQSRAGIQKDAERLRMALEQLLGRDAEGLIRVVETEPGFSLTLGSLVLFDPGSASLKKEAEPIMDEVARFLGDWPGGIRVAGHTDDLPIQTASYPSNWELSMARAVDIVRFFERSGVDGTRLVAEGRASTKPMVANDSPEHRSMNRRVEIFLDCYWLGPMDVTAGAGEENTWLSPVGPPRDEVIDVPGSEWSGSPEYRKERPLSQQVIWVRKGNGAQEGMERKGPRGADQPFGVRRVRVLKEVDSRMENLPPFPTVLNELIGLTNSDKSAADDLRGCIEKDAVLTARILKLANSAFYSPTVPVASVQQAVVMLGFLSVRSLGMAAATLKFLGAEFHPYGIFPGGLWMHTYATAELAREFGREAKEDQDAQDAVYVGGLLHDIGKIVLGPILEGLCRDADQERRVEEGEEIIEWERRISDLDHCEVGGRLAEKWRLAPVTVASVRHHHVPADADPSTVRAVAIVNLANLAAHRLGVGFHEVDADEIGEAAMRDMLGISLKRYLEITDGYTSKVENVKELFTGLK